MIDFVVRGKTDRRSRYLDFSNCVAVDCEKTANVCKLVQRFYYAFLNAVKYLLRGSQGYADKY